MQHIQCKHRNLKEARNVNKNIKYKSFIIILVIISLCVLFDLIRISKYNTHNAPNSKNNKIEEIKGTEVSKQEEEISFQDDTEIIETTEIEENTIPDFSLELFNMINDYREQHGLVKYIYDTDLQNSANVRANEASICWSHNRPDGSYFNTVDYLSYGENLAKTYTTTSEVLKAWEESPTHNANLLDCDFRNCAIAHMLGEDGIYYTSIEFSY